ncbi:hypothetical protein JCM30237_05980 [Halolamina litorea]|uniref:Uncharacterized protein n=1 Tax=Halolamina litorea TaxID=1515593 RepID=A0ABD6BPG9_9EURY|nr:hypothetical protein [Halolamina litorea]
MLTVQEVDSALEAAREMAASNGETLQDWYRYVGPNQEPVHLYRDAEEKHLLQVARGETLVALCRQVDDPESDIGVEGITFHYTKRIEILEVIIAFFLKPEGAFEALQDAEGVERIVLSKSEDDVPWS